MVIFCHRLWFENQLDSAQFRFFVCNFREKVHVSLSVAKTKRYTWRRSFFVVFPSKMSWKCEIERGKEQWKSSYFYVDYLQEFHFAFIFCKYGKPNARFAIFHILLISAVLFVFFSNSKTEWVYEYFLVSLSIFAPIFMVSLSFVFIFISFIPLAHLDVFTGIRFDASFILYSNQNLSNLMPNLKAIFFSSPNNVLLLCLVYTKRFALFSLPLSLSFCFLFLFSIFYFVSQRLMGPQSVLAAQLSQHNNGWLAGWLARQHKNLPYKLI